MRACRYTDTAHHHHHRVARITGIMRGDGGNSRIIDTRPDRRRRRRRDGNDQDHDHLLCARARVILREVWIVQSGFAYAKQVSFGALQRNNNHQKGRQKKTTNKTVVMRYCCFGCWCAEELWLTEMYTLLTKMIESRSAKRGTRESRSHEER